MSFRSVSSRRSARRTGLFPGAVPPARSSSRGSSRAAVRQSAVASRKPKSKPRLRLRTEEPSAASRPTRFKSTDGESSAAGIRLASGTEKQAAGAANAAAAAATDGPKQVRRRGREDAKRQAAPARASVAVQTIDIRPSGTVVSRRPATKRPAILHLPKEPAGRLPPPSWMMEECHVAPA